MAAMPPRSSWAGRATASPALHRRHRVDGDARGVLRQDAIVARRDQPRGLVPRSAMQERREVLFAPGIVDHQQAAPIIERFGKRDLGRLDGAEAGPLAGEGLDQVGDAADQIVGLLAQRDAQDAVAERVLDVAVVAQRVGERRLAEAAGAAQGRGDRDRLALRVEELRLIPSNFSGRSTKPSGSASAMKGTRFSPAGPLSTWISRSRLSGMSMSWRWARAIQRGR